MTRLLLASFPVVTCVLILGGLADFHTPSSRTAFALGVLAATLGYLAGDWAEGR